ncbi:uncharacterized protein LOC118755949, partial [Rhagoletis pomonella]|uniref:uncharacterized protein LOC118755949 n=1 Tax=Rhagoletis pomonella TaxID=28610 RepID=UPI0017846B8A
MPLERSPKKNSLDAEFSTQTDAQKTPEIDIHSENQGAVPKKITRSVTASRNQKEREYDPSMSIFIFEADNLVHFCTKFSSLPIDELTVPLLKSYREDIDEYYAEVKRAYRNVSLAEDGELPPTFKLVARNKMELCQDRAHNVKAQISDLMDVQMAQMCETSRLAEKPPFPVKEQENTFMCLNVPPCDTETFSGGYEEWPSFRDMFTAVYINHPKLTPAQKLYHLRYKTTGKAGALVKQYGLCGENFTLAWNALKSRYENKRILVDKQIKTLLTLSQVHFENSEALQTLQNSINNSLSVLNSQGVPTENWDPILVYICSSKLPQETLSLWEQSLSSRKDLPTWEQMNEFLTKRYEVVERLHGMKHIKPGFVQNRSHNRTQNFYVESNTTNPCPMCEGNHPLRFCFEFKKLSVRDKYKVVRENQLCENCFSFSHLRSDCSSQNTCAVCHRNHHSLLHVTTHNDQSQQEKNVSQASNRQTLRRSRKPQNPKETRNPTAQGNHNTSQTPTNATDNSQSPANTYSPQVQSMHTVNEGKTLLPTALVLIENFGVLHKVRALIDQGSQKTFITSKVQNRLRLPTRKAQYEISGMGGKLIQNSSHICSVKLVSPKNRKSIDTQAIVLPQLTRLLPTFTIEKPDWNQFAMLDLADPNCFQQAQIDMIIGSDLIPQIMLSGIHRNICGGLLAQNTIFGWIISGPITYEVSVFSTQVEEVSNELLSTQLRQFWEQEELYHPVPISEEDIACEDYYQRTTYREPDGRYVVRLPFKSSFPNLHALGQSRSYAYSQLISMEKNLARKGNLKAIYDEILEEYLTMDHMEPTSSQEIASDSKYFSFYLPHHAVVRPDKTTTKVRVVFNGSRNTSSGYSLNDVLHVGPALQPDLMALILRWRLYQFVYNGDIEKMYRQIRVHQDDQEFQRILFRRPHNSEVQDFRLKTVTFGVNCAPFLAIRTLQQLAKDSRNRFPLAEQVLLRDTYVDDILSGSHTIPDAVNKLSEVIKTLASAGFPLRKITANNPKILEKIPKSDLLDSDFLKFESTSSTKTLGMRWNALSDTFSYSVAPINATKTATKRQISSTIAKLFDPAGWVLARMNPTKLVLQS